MFVANIWEEKYLLWSFNKHQICFLSWKGLPSFPEGRGGEKSWVQECSKSDESLYCGTTDHFYRSGSNAALAICQAYYTWGLVIT